MKLIKKLLFLIFILTLTGCSERALTFDRTYPDTTKLDKFREKIQLELEEEIRNLPKLIMETSAMPRKLEIISEDNKNLLPISATQYCWDLNYLNCERMAPVNPFDIPNYKLLNIHVNSAELLKVSASYSPIHYPIPVRIEIYQFDKNKNLNLFQTIDSSTNNFDFTPPTEPGIYTFLFKVIYQWEIDGIAYHPLQVYVH